MSNPSTEQTLCTTDTTLADTAYRLLELQQKLDAWDRLYNEEVRGLRKELSLLTASYMQECQSRRQTAQPRRRRRTEQTTPHIAGHVSVPVVPRSRRQVKECQ